MRRAVLSLTLLSSINFLNAQTTFPTNRVGINTANPQRTFHIEGDLKVSNIKDVSENSLYSNVLITDNTGNVDHVLRTDFLPNPDPFTSNKEVHNSIYNNGTNTAKPEKEVKCGKFVFLFEQDGNATDIRFKLRDQPATDIEVYVSMEQNWRNEGNTGAPGFEFIQGTTNTNTNAFTFLANNPTSPNHWSKPHDFAASNVVDYEQNTIHLQYPNDSSLYRLTVYKVKQTNSWDFVTVCEKF